MTHIEQMIKDLCPNGVEWRTFDELGTFYGGLSGKTKDDFKDGNAKFITYLNIANNPALRLDIEDTVQIGPNEKQNIVQYGDALFTGSSETPDECAMSSVVTEHPTEKLYLNSFCFGFRFNSLEGIDPAFFKHYFRSTHFRTAVRKTANGTTRFNVSKKEFAKLEIPLPPLEIQKKIVECLDKFSALAAELQAELQARRKQYEYYRTHLLTPTSNSNSVSKSDDCNWVFTTLGEIGKVCMCKRILKQQTNSSSGIPFYKIGTFGGKADAYIDEATFNEYKSKYSYPKKGDVLISAAGTIGKGVVFDGAPSYFQDSNIVWIDNDEKRVLNKYLYHYYQIIQWKVDDGGVIKRLYNDNLKAANIAFPPLAEQERIVALLDKFEALTTSLSEGIPAEQAAQQRRYEYYRDLLLTFDKR